jgi:hypothetical protein
MGAATTRPIPVEHSVLLSLGRNIVLTLLIVLSLLLLSPLIV